jgi:hypothetical protein
MRVRSLVAGVVVASWIVACGGASAPSAQAPAGACPKPTGAYLLTMNAAEGDCAGMIRHREQLVVMGQPEQPGCRSIDEHATLRPEGCVYESTQACERSDLKMLANVSVAVPPDARDMRGSLVVQVDGNGGGRCIQRYDVRYLKNGP